MTAKVYHLDDYRTEELGRVYCPDCGYTDVCAVPTREHVRVPCDACGAREMEVWRYSDFV